MTDMVLVRATDLQVIAWQAMTQEQASQANESLFFESTLNVTDQVMWITKSVYTSTMKEIGEIYDQHNSSK